MRPLTPFDYTRPVLRTIEDAALMPGDLAQFRGRGLIASWIRWVTMGVHTHSGIVTRNGVGPDLLEIREFIGGRRIPLSAAVDRAPGRIDIFRPREAFDLNTLGTVRVMRTITARDYGYWGIARLALYRLPFVWRLCRISTRDVIEGKGDNAPFCSQAVAIAYRLGGGVDPVPRKPDHLVTPADLTSSLLFDYHCTLIPDVAS